MYRFQSSCSTVGVLAMRISRSFWEARSQRAACGAGGIFSIAENLMIYPQELVKVRIHNILHTSMLNEATDVRHFRHAFKST